MSQLSHCPTSRGLGHWDRTTPIAMSHYYTLQKYTNPSSRHTCPACGRPRCFTLYVDPDANPLHETVGRCDHESSCGYHRTPRQYFHDHPQHRPEHGHDRHHCHPERPSVIPSERSESRDLLHYRHARPDRASPGIIPQNLIPPPSGTNHLTTYLKTMLPSSAIDRIIADYRLASTPDQAIIFLQIDKAGQCRTGKIMQYDPNTGHRIKDPDKPGRINWLHSILKRRKQLPSDWQLTQCLFGEHLLLQHPDKTIALVESEKTAIICSAMMPQYLWLATGGKSQFNSRLTALKGRKIIAFPDIDAYHDWLRRTADFPHLDLKVSDLLEKHTTQEDRAAHIDLADWLIQFLTDNK